MSPLPIFLFLTSALQLTDNQVLPLLVKGLGERDEWPEIGESGALDLMAAYALGAAAGPLLVTRLFPHFRGRIAIVTGLALLAFAQVGFSMVPPFAVAMGWRALAGAASGILSYALLIEAVAAGNRAVTLMTSGFLLAYVAGIPTGAKLEASVGLSTFYVGFGAVSLFLAVTAAFVVPRGTAKPPDTSTRSFASFFRERRFALGLLTSVVIGAALVGPVALFPTALQDPDGAALSQDSVGNLYYLAGLGPLLALSLAPRLLHRFGRRRVAVVGAAALAVPLLLMPLGAAAPWSGAALLIAALLIETLRRTALQGHLGTLPNDDDRPRYLALRNVCVQVSIAIGILAAQRVSNVGGLAAACGVAAVLALLAAATVPQAARSVAS
ncbi:MAG: hypothetical protein CMJ83_20815 [Planctomycetes bacterium]|nr:hypothetical protein [Planctomycetota bacterium]